MTGDRHPAPPCDAEPVPAVDVVDSTWFAARPAVVAAVVARPVNWPRWWPGLDLRVDELRGARGVRWLVPQVRRGPATGLAGSAEVWLEASCGGAVGHFFLRLRPVDGVLLDARTARGVEHHYRLLTKRSFWALADELDPGRFDRLTRSARAVTG